MASIKNSLRKIYTALGGTNTKSKTITGLLDDISTVASGGGGEKDSLTVFVEAELNNLTNVYTINSVSNTCAEIEAALMSNKHVSITMHENVMVSGQIVAEEIRQFGNIYNNHDGDLHAVLTLPKYDNIFTMHVLSCNKGTWSFTMIEIS